MWKFAFDELRPELRTAGLKAGFVFSNAKDSNQIKIISEIDNLSKARVFVAADVLSKAMQQSGAKGSAHVYRLEDTDRPPQ